MSELALNSRIERSQAVPDPDALWAEREYVFRLARSIVLFEDVAEDIAQDVLIRTLRAKDPIRNLRAFLRTATVRLALNYLRQKRPITIDESAASQSDNSDIRLQVRQILQQLSPDSRTILALSYFEHLSYREIASELGIPEGTVASRLSAARLAFRDLWGNENE
ncbi:MAG: sigma-70 family RNA polymerase sigma factor [Fimbriimonadaceae bacterium]